MHYRKNINNLLYVVNGRVSPPGGVVKDHSSVATEIVSPPSKLILLGSKSGDEMLRQGIMTLFGKPADQEDEGQMSWRTVLNKSEFRLFLY